MGLDTTHNCWHGAYSAFQRWRATLAKVAGYETLVVDDWGAEHPNIDWDGIEKIIGRDLDGIWPDIPVNSDGTPDAIIVLLAHSDRDGYIQTDMCGPLADRLEELLPKLEGMDGGGHLGDYVAKTKQFIKGLRTASRRGEPVGFH